MNDFFEKNNPKIAYLKTALPLVLSLMMTVVYNMADMYFISYTKNTDLIAGVSICAPVLTFLMAFGNIFGVGSSSVVSRLLGSRNVEETRRTSSFGFYTSLLTGVVLGAFFLIFCSPILSLLGSDSATFEYAKEYYTWLSIGAPFIVANFVHTNLMRSEGLSALSMVASVGGIIINIILDPIFITVLGMGAKGAAIATVIGYVFTVLFCFIIVLKKSPNLSVNIRQMNISRENFRQLAGIGISAALTNIMQTICYIVINQFLLPYGNTYIAAMGIVIKIVMIAHLILTGFAFGSQPPVGYFYGSGNKKTMKSIIRFIALFTCVLALALTLIIELAAQPLFSIFLNDPVILATGTSMLRIIVSSSLFVNLVLVITLLFQSTGKVTESLIMSLLRQGIVFIISIVLLNLAFGYTGIILSQPIADFVSAAIAVVLYKKRMKI